jgi:predicted Zn-dependent protease
LKARQAFNLALLKESGRPPPEVVHVYALSALDVREYALAADLFQKLERLDAKRDHAINISYAYACAGMKKLSKEWKVIALKRNPDDPIALYNHSLETGNEEAIPILRRSINLDPNHRLAQIRLANILIERGEEEGKSIITNALKDMVEDLDAHQLDANGCLILAKVASDLGETFLARRAEARAATLSGGKRPSIDNKNLADSVQPIAQLEKI